MAAQIFNIFPGVTRESRNRRQISGMSTGNQRGGQGGGQGLSRGRGRGRGSGRERVFISGVDIADPYRNFTREEWTKLSEDNVLDTIRRIRQGRSNLSGRAMDVDVDNSIADLQSVIPQHNIKCQQYHSPLRLYP